MPERILKIVSCQVNSIRRGQTPPYRALRLARGPVCYDGQRLPVSGFQVKKLPDSAAVGVCKVCFAGVGQIDIGRRRAGSEQDAGEKLHLAKGLPMWSREQAQNVANFCFFIEKYGRAGTLINLFRLCSRRMEQTGIHTYCFYER
jgi:hypothetical protein